MERRDKDGKQSSLPSSLIPHLYSGPQTPRDSSIRATLAPSHANPPPRPETEESIPPLFPRSASPALILPPVVPPLLSLFIEEPRRSRAYANYEQTEHEYDEPSPSDVQPPGPPDSPRPLIRYPPAPSAMFYDPRPRYTSPILSDPIFHAAHSQMPPQTSYARPHFPPQEPPTLRRSWQEGEAGPSSLTTTAPRDLGRARRGSSQPARLGPRTDNLSRSERFGSDNESFSRQQLRDTSEVELIQSFQRVGRDNESSYSSQFSRSLQELGPAMPLRYENDEQVFADPYAGYDPFGFARNSTPRRPWSAENVQHPALEYLPNYPAPNYPAPAPPAPVVSPEQEGPEQSSGASKGKRRRWDSEEMEEPPRKHKVVRKTAVACHFCRGRKLRCNGARPTCFNCSQRMLKCEYVSVQRRRGPGKAPKGSRSKKAAAAANARLSESSSSQPPGGGDQSGGGFDYETLAPELRPQTSVMTLDQFTFQPPEAAPTYPTEGDDQNFEHRGRQMHTLRRQPSTEGSSESDKGQEETDQ